VAKVTFTIEDNLETGKVNVVSDPSFETMCKMDLSGEKLTAAHGYALFCINQLRKESQSRSPIIRANIPTIGRL
jgi:hypothetical protein